MRILILTFGTRGDVQPYVALARALVGSGHTVTVSTADGFREVVIGHGVNFIPAGSRQLEIIQNAMPTLRGPRDVVRIQRELLSAMRTGLQEQAQAAADVSPDLIIYHPKCLAGPHLAERYDIAGVLSLPLPFYTPTRDFPIPFIADWPLGGRVNRLSYQFTRITNLIYGRMINNFRRNLGLRPAGRFSDPFRDHTGAPVEVLYPYSRHVVPIPADYPSTAHVTGYWFLPREPDWQPEQSLINFLDGGAPPVYVGFGSMGFGNHSAERLAAVRHALAAVRVRGVVATGWGGLSAADSTDDLKVVDQVPHDWLFPRMAAVVHHGGAGTTAAGLAAGRPTLITPFLGDQGFWGHRVQRLGVGPEPLPQNKITASSLTERIAELITGDNYRRSAEALATKINSEDGVGTAVRTIENLCRRRGAASTSPEDD